MDERRLDMISKHIDEMDSGLADMIKRFTDFTQNEKPRIAVVCSDNHMRIEMEQIFTVRTDVDAVVCAVNSENENLYDLMLSDAVVAVTSALQIAPKGMYDILQKLNSVSKEVYVLLGGWGNLPKTSEMRVSKAERVPQEFPLSKIVSVKNYYNKECEGFSLPEKAAEEYMRHIKVSFEKLHSTQSEELYAWLKKNISDFYDECNKEIDNEILIAINSSRKIIAKQSRFALEFTHSGVSMRTLAELAAKRMSSITIAELEDTCGDLESMVRGDKHSAERSAKRALAHLLVKSLDSCLGEGDNPVKIMSQATANDCRIEMKAISAEISNTKYVSDELKQTLSREVNNNDDLDKIVCKYDEIAQLTLKRARERIPAIVKSYHYSLAPQVKDRIWEAGCEVRGSIVKSITGSGNLESDKLPSNIDMSDKFPQKEDSELSKVEYFFADTEKMLRDSILGAADLIYECGKEVTGEINEYSELMIKGYFGRIAAVLGHIEKYLETLHDSYVLE